MLRAIACSLVPLLAACAAGGSDDYEVIREYPHDRTAYTQGLIHYDGWLYESTGLLGQSTLRRVELETGRVDAGHRLADDRFGEGLTRIGDRLYQLTWQSGVGYVYDLASLAVVDSFAYDGEGWGLTTDGELLVMSDGTSGLRYLDPGTFETVRSVAVRDAGAELSQLNELEWVDGVVYANVYRSDWIVKIDPASGDVLAWYDFAGLLPDRRRGPNTDVLNGIAHVEETGHFLLTGKNWPTLFEVRLVDSLDGGRP